MADDQPRIELLAHTSDDILQEIGRLRYAVWRAEPDVNRGALPDEVWLDGLDPVATHWVARDEYGKIIAAARVTIHDRVEDVPYSDSFDDAPIDSKGPFAPLNRLVVDPRYRGRGLARELDRARLAYAAQEGADCVLVVAVKRRMEALAHLGFRRLGQARRTGSLLRVDGTYEVGIHQLAKHG